MHIALSALLLTRLVAAGGAEDFLLKIGDPAPPFAMRDLNKGMFSLQDHVGAGAKDPRKAAFVVFFATWCEPCKKEIPIIKKIHQRWKAKGVEIVYVGLSQGHKELGPFAQQEKLPWRVIPDSFGLLSRRYGASQLPHVILVDKSGNVAFQHRGISNDLQTTLETQLVRITGEKMPEGSAESLAVDAPRFQRKLMMGRLPSGEGAAARWEPLAAYLGEAARAQMEITTDASYGDFEKALRAGKYDVVNAGPLLCNELRELYEPLARIERQGTQGYLGILFATRASKLKIIADLRGKTIGLVAPRSTSGGLYPQKALLDAGLVPGKDVTVKWLGSHTKVAQAVKDGKVDAGGCYEDCRDSAWLSAGAKAAATQVLGYTPEIPAEMIVVKRSLDAATKQALRDALIRLNQEEGILEQMSQGELPISGLTSASDKDLVAVAEVDAFVRARTPAN